MGTAPLPPARRGFQGRTGTQDEILRNGPIRGESKRTDVNENHTTKATKKAHKRALQVEQTRRAKALVAEWRTAQSAGEDVIASSRRLRGRVKRGVVLSELTSKERPIVEGAWARDDEDRREPRTAETGDAKEGDRV